MTIRKAMLAALLAASSVPALAGGRTCIGHTKAGGWPVMDLDGTRVEGNPWVFAKVRGRWYAATYEWLRPGQTCKMIVPSNIGAHTKKAPLEGWAPAWGEEVGFMVSALARSSERNAEERSNVVLVRWGTDRKGGSSGEDELDLSQVTWLHTNVSRWERSSRVTDVYFEGGRAAHDSGGVALSSELSAQVNAALAGSPAAAPGQTYTYTQTGYTTTTESDGPPGKTCVRHSKAGKWPVIGEGDSRGEGNPWVFANLGGQWYAATYEWLRPGQVCKLITQHNIGAHTKKDPLRFWAPAYGETVGLMMSTFARDSTRSSNERTNVVLVRWGHAQDGPESGEDQIDLSKVIWLHADVSGWARTSKVANVSFEGASAAP